MIRPSEPGADLPAPPWAGHAVNRRRVLSRDAIIEAGLEIAAREGTEAVTMRRVAGKLGVAASSLYVHVRTRDELLQLALRSVMDRVEPPGEGPDWKADLRDYFLRLHAALSVHGDLARFAFADLNMPTGEDDLLQLERLMARLTGAGIDPRTAIWAIDRLLLLTVADVFEAWEFASRDDETRAWLTSLAGYLRQVPADRYPTLSQHAELLVSGGQRDRFLLGLDLLLDGLSMRIDGG